MAKGIQIKKPDHVKEVKQPDLTPLAPAAAEPLTLSPLMYLMLALTFPAAFVALYFFIQIRPV